MRQQFKTQPHSSLTNVPTRPDVLHTLGFLEKIKLYKDKIEYEFLQSCVHKFNLNLDHYVIVEEQVVGDPFKYILWCVRKDKIADQTGCAVITRASFNRLTTPSMFVDLTPVSVSAIDKVTTQVKSEGAQYVRPVGKPKRKQF